MSSLNEVRHIASKCNHFGMCKIDFLGTGVCPSGSKSKYVSYFPQGRMEIANALANQIIQVTEELVEIVRACNLCGICDKQCNFVTNLRPGQVMKALKSYIDSYLKNNNPVKISNEDGVLRTLREAVGEKWASNDPAILIAYSRDTALFSERIIPKYVVMPESRDELIDIIKIAKQNNLPCIPRSSGGSGQGLALGKGIIIDFYRMKIISVDTDNWSATIEPGITAWELQREVVKHGMRFSVAEPSAGIISNILTTRLISPFSHAYGTGGDLVIDAEFIDTNGEVYYLNDNKSPNLHVHNKNLNPTKKVISSSMPPKVTFETIPPSFIFTKMKIKLFPKLNDEEGFLIPFSDFQEATNLATDLAKRRIGTGLGVISADYCSFIIANTSRGKKELEYVLQEKLEINYFLIILGDSYTRKVIESITDSFIDDEIFQIIMRSISQLYGNDGIELLADLPSTKKPYEVIFKKEMIPLLKMALSPSIESTVRYVDDDLKEFYKILLARPELSNLMWLMMFRITTARLGRDNNFFEVIGWMSTNNLKLADEVFDELKSIGDKYNIRSGFGYCVTQEIGKWIFFEFDYFYNCEEKDKNEAKKAVLEALKLIDKYVKSKNLNALMLPENCVSQGICRTENLLYQSNDLKTDNKVKP